MALVVSTAGPVQPPTPEEVHALIPTRGPFTATSRPTRAEVEVIIRGKLAEVDIEVADTADLPADLLAFAKSVIAFGAAADIEAGFFPEQQFGDGGRERSLTAAYLRMLDRLRERLGSMAGGNVGARSASIALVDPALW